jgi:hypothetical protein
LAEKSRELIKRWSAPESAELAVEAVFRLIGGESFADWPMGEVNGRADLRGLPSQCLPACEMVRPHAGGASRGETPPGFVRARVRAEVLVAVVELDLLSRTLNFGSASFSLAAVPGSRVRLVPSIDQVYPRVPNVS